jgi:hypothetical protein
MKLTMVVTLEQYCELSKQLAFPSQFSVERITAGQAATATATSILPSPPLPPAAAAHHSEPQDKDAPSSFTSPVSISKPQRKLRGRGLKTVRLALTKPSVLKSLSGLCSCSIMAGHRTPSPLSFSFML